MLASEHGAQKIVHKKNIEPFHRCEFPFTGMCLRRHESSVLHLQNEIDVVVVLELSKIIYRNALSSSFQSR